MANDPMGYAPTKEKHKELAEATGNAAFVGLACGLCVAVVATRSIQAGDEVLPRNTRCISTFFVLLGSLHWLHRHAQAARTSSWQSAPLKDHVLRRIAVRLAAPAELCEASRSALIQESRTDAKHEHETRRRTRKHERVCASLLREQTYERASL